MSDDHWQPSKLLPFRYSVTCVPHQVNEYDCGVLAMIYLDKFLRDPERPKLDAPKEELEAWFPPVYVYQYRYVP